MLKRIIKNNDFSIIPLSIEKKILQKLNNNLLLVYTGIKRTAHEIAKGYIGQLQNSKKKHILEILNFVNEGELALKSGNLNDFGKLLHESWLAKKGLSKSISNNKIDELYNDVIGKGAIGGKLLGAGGGGFILFYVNKNKINNFKKKLIKLNILQVKPTNTGSIIIHNDI